MCVSECMGIYYSKINSFNFFTFQVKLNDITLNHALKLTGNDTAELQISWRKHLLFFNFVTLEFLF